MANLRPSFPVLEDFSTQAGLPLHKVLEGDAAAAKNALASLIAKDPSGNLIYLRANASGELIINNQSGEVACLTASGSVGGSATFVNVATITLTNDLVYKKLGYSVSCFRDAEFRIVQVDDVGGTPVETIHAYILAGAGDFTDSNEMECVEFTAGSTGVVELQLRGMNINALSDLKGMISILELQA